jgi:hypothetical protein
MYAVDAECGFFRFHEIILYPKCFAREGDVLSCHVDESVFEEQLGSSVHEAVQTLAGPFLLAVNGKPG